MRLKPLVRLLEDVTLVDAATHLSAVLGDDVAEHRVYELALGATSPLRLAVRLPTPAQVTSEAPDPASRARAQLQPGAYDLDITDGVTRAEVERRRRGVAPGNLPRVELTGPIGALVTDAQGHRYRFPMYRRQNPNGRDRCSALPVDAEIVLRRVALEAFERAHAKRVADTQRARDRNRKRPSRAEEKRIDRAVAGEKKLRTLVTTLDIKLPAALPLALVSREGDTWTVTNHLRTDEPLWKMMAAEAAKAKKRPATATFGKQLFAILQHIQRESSSS